MPEHTDSGTSVAGTKWCSRPKMPSAGSNCWPTRETLFYFVGRERGRILEANATRDGGIRFSRDALLGLTIDCPSLY